MILITDFENLMETLEILSDSEAMAEIAAGERAIAEDEFVRLKKA